MVWKKFEWAEIWPFCNRKIVICRDCIYQLKPAAGIDNDPQSLCMKTVDRLDFVTGKWIRLLCKDKNKDGACIEFINKAQQ